MALPFNLTQMLSRAMLSDTTLRVLSHATSVTDGIDTTNVVADVLADQPEFYFRPNNDFGMLVDYLGACAYRDNIGVDRYKDTTLYNELCSDDGYVDHALHDIAFSLAGFMISAHAMLRDVIPDNVATLMGLIESDMKDRVATDLLDVPEVHVQTWGQLGDEAYRLRVMYTCRTLANIYEEGRPIRKYYALAALAAAERLASTELPESLRQEATTCLSSLLGEACSEQDSRFYQNVLFKSYGINNFVAAARVALESGEALERGLAQLVQLENLIKALSIKSTSSELCVELADWLAKKLPVLETVCLLCAGAYYSLAVTTYLDTLILAANPQRVSVNGFRMASFKAAGGTTELLVAFGYYLKAHHMSTAYTGWTEHRVLTLREKVTDEILQARVERERRLQVDNTVMLRTVIERSITRWLSESQIIAKLKTPDAVFQRALSTVSTKATNPDLALGDLLTDFCIELRDQSILKRLKAAIFNELTPYSPEREPTLAERKKAITIAFTKVLMQFLINRYGEVEA